MLLGLGNIDHHLGCRMVDVHLVENRHAVIGDDDFAKTVDQHRIQTLGTDRPLHGGGNSPHGRRIRHQRRQALVRFIAA